MTDSKREAAGNPLLRKLEGFVPLPEADRAALLKISENPQVVSAGTDLIREGEPPDGMFLILDGFACRYKLRENGARQIMAYLVPGDAGDVDGPLLRAMDHSICTLSACKVARIAPDTIWNLLQRPAVAAALRKSTLVDEATLREWLLNVGRRSAPERLAHLFCELHLRLRAVGRADENGFELPITQYDLADTTGQTSVHVNRSLRELRERGLIKLRQRHLTILDLPGLRQFAEFKSGYLHLGDQAAA
ncbi:Crp/Fnr family transcriptional regulator [Methylobacterium sp. E-065]|uniref:Crp/Fnr family transcriptional regulator n=1 Tax=Methylobacterium sp. E-065 TaxID=2836583 RepID=UPI001FB88814|nr:Crp/Fnr family transcriptional regulator [Methylobacterium sp. E-065]MCJ2019577.1 Crp/Fnr family transcriptional regulator [Methylobacterium sp. E-065]